MVIVSEKKAFEVVKFETIIKRCPICLSDTEQTAYYARAPELSVTVHMDTDPPCDMKVSQETGHAYEWDVLAECSRCHYMYRVMGVPRMRIKDIPKDTSAEEHELALTCCDICYNEYYKYTISDVFINLSNFGKVYLCGEHAREAEQERKKEGAYTSLAARLSRWSHVKEKPIVVHLEDGRQLILKSNKDISTRILAVLHMQGPMPRGDVRKDQRLRGSDGAAFDDAVSYLKGMSLIHEQQQGAIIKRQVISLTDEGRLAASALVKKFR
ncbi:MAG: hypothetical protein M1321_03135 [Candidatus Marsarchaeota archaeon]|jgi:hypothetical protein|nr:hypothetical protein [Candidatus Marsarchaeota archaeon]